MYQYIEGFYEEETWSEIYRERGESEGQRDMEREQKERERKEKRG